MATKKQTPTPTAAPAPAPAANPFAGIVDELGALEKELAPWQSKIARVDMLRKQLREAHKSQPVDKEIHLQGDRFIAILGPKGSQTVIDFVDLVKRIKAAAFAKFATCTLAALLANADPEVVQAVTRTEQIGPRTLKVLEKGTQA